MIRFLDTSRGQAFVTAILAHIAVGALAAELAIIDGDTFRQNLAGVPAVKYRLYGIDAPESRQAGGSAASNALRRLMRRASEAHIYDVDRYGRKVVVVHLRGGGTVQAEMLRAGHAWFYPQYCREAFCAHWSALELQARRNRVGLWAGSSPLAPWDFRR